MRNEIEAGFDCVELQKASGPYMREKYDCPITKRNLAPTMLYTVDALVEILRESWNATVTSAIKSSMFSSPA
jgi:hypothetical protein